MSATNDHDPNLHDGYVGVSRKDLVVMPDSELTQWQHNHKNEPPLVTLAERKWQRRIISHQLKEQFDLSSRLAKAAEEHSANIAEENRKHTDQIAKVNRWWGIGAAIVSVTDSLLGVWLGKSVWGGQAAPLQQESVTISKAATQPPESSKSNW